jgi:TP901 family phage tail tape measure protein
MSNPANITINIDGDVFMAINELKVQFDRLTNSVASMEGKVDGAFQHMVDGAGRAQSSLRILAFDAINRISDTLGQPFRAGTDAVYGYDGALRELSAITNIAGEGLDQMGASARQMALDFGGSAAGHLNTYQVLLSKLTPELAKAPDALEDMGRTTATLAKTMKGDTAGAVNAITAAMNQYAVDLSNPVQAAKAARDMMNQMAAAAQIGAVEVPSVAAALQQSGAAARAANVSFIETNAALQVLGKFGKEGAEGGVALRNVLGILNRQDFLPKEVRERLRAAGVDITALADKTRPLAERLELLKKISGTNLLAGMFGTENQVAAQALIENTDLIRQFTREINEAGPAGERMAETIGAGYKETHDRILQFFENIKISVFGITGDVLPWLDTIFGQLGGILQLAPGIMAMVEIFKMMGLATKMQALWTTILGGVTKVLTAIQWALNAAFIASPIGWVILAVGALVGAFVYAWNKFEGFRKFLYGLWESFKAVFMNIGKLASGVLGGIGQMLVGIFTFDIDQIKAGFSQFKGAFAEYGKNITLAYDTGEEKSEARDAAKKTKGKEDTMSSQPQGETQPSNPFQDNKEPPLVPSPIQPSGGNASGGGSAGNASTRNVNMKIENLVGKIEIVTQKFTESPARIQELVKEALVGAVRDTEVVIS